MATGALVAIVVAAALVAAVVIAVLLWLREGRARAMRAFAQNHGLSYMGDTWVLGDCDFTLFGKGSRRHWSNVLTGTWSGTTVVYADYEFTEPEGHAQQTYLFSTVVTDLGTSMPVVEVMSRTVAGELVDELGVHGVDFESEEFNRRYLVESRDERFAHELVDARMIEALLACPPDMHVQFGPERMVVWCRRRAPAELAPVLDAAAALDRRAPVMVRSEHALPAGAAGNALG